MNRFIAFFFALFAAMAYSAEPTIKNMRPPPVMAHGVSQCGEIIALWILQVDPDGEIRAYRTDVFHHPDSPEEYNAFLLWVKTTAKGQLDMFELPCKDKAKTAS